jgi:hypothetical protein
MIINQIFKFKRTIHVKPVKDSLKRINQPVSASHVKSCGIGSKPGIVKSLFDLPPLQRLAVVMWFSGLGLFSLWAIEDNDVDDKPILINDKDKSFVGFIQWSYEMAKNDYLERNGAEKQAVPSNSGQQPQTNDD